VSKEIFGQQHRVARIPGLLNGRDTEDQKANEEDDAAHERVEPTVESASYGSAGMDGRLLTQDHVLI
jgi:hypothetical protein